MQEYPRSRRDKHDRMRSPDSDLSPNPQASHKAKVRKGWWRNAEGRDGFIVNTPRQVVTQ